MFLCKLSVLLLIFGSLTTISLVHGTDEQPQTFSRLCYYTTQRGLSFAAINGTLCTHVIIGFALVENSTLVPGNATDIDIYSQVRPFKAYYPGVKVMLSAGGGGNSLTGGGFHQAASSLYNRIKFASSALNMMNKYDFDGLDIDWEFPGWHDSWPEDQYLFVLLLKQLSLFFKSYPRRSNSLRDRLRTSAADSRHLSPNPPLPHSQPLLLSAAVTGDYTVGDPSYLYAEIGRHVDFINLMTYDYHIWQPVLPFTGHNSPLFARSVERGYFATLNTAWAAYYWFQKGVPKEKIMIGIPFYAQAFELVLPEIHGVDAPAKYDLGQWSMSQVCEFLSADGSTRVWDPEAQVPYAYRGQQWVSYEDSESVAAKVRWVLANGFGGVMTFNLNSDDWQGNACSRQIPGFENFAASGIERDRFPLQTLIYNLTAIL